MGGPTLKVAAALLVAVVNPVAAQDSRIVLGVPDELVRGTEALRRGDYAEGVELTLRGLNGKLSLRNRAAALSNLCAGYHGLNRPEEALGACRRSLELNEHNWRTWHNLALTHLLLDQPRLARRAVERGLELAPDSTRLIATMELIESTRSTYIVFEEQLED